MKRSREPELDTGEYSTTSTTPASSDDIGPVTKFVHSDYAVEDQEDQDDNLNDTVKHRVEMRCSLPPHRDPLIFNTYSEYEAHYNKFHTNRCLECGKNFPSEHLLGVHIEEFHDPLVVVRRDKGEHTYSCFVEGCERKCLTHQKRRMHLVDKHMYPKNFFFAITKEGIDGRRSLLVESGHRRRRSSTAHHSKESRRRGSLREGNGAGGGGDAGSKDAAAPSTATSQAQTVAKDPAQHVEGAEHPADTDMADLTSAMSAMQFVPPSVRFGRGRAGFPKR